MPIEPEKNVVVFCGPGVTQPAVTTRLLEHPHLVAALCVGLSSEDGADTLTVFVTDGGSKEAITDLLNLALLHTAH